MAIRFGRETCGELPAAERREWWVGNGRGAYAAGTLALTLTRRYHGLLIAPVDPPLGRALVLAKADAELVIGNERYPLFANRWASGAVAPEGHLAIESFQLDGSIPVWRFAVAGYRVEQRIWMEPGKHTTYVAWRLLTAPEGSQPRLAIALLANGRDHHGETWIPGFAPEIAAAGEHLEMQVRDRFVLRVQTPDGCMAARRDWIENFDLPMERERGLSDRDHHLCIGHAEVPLAADRWHGLIASIASEASSDIGAAVERRQAHDRRVIERALQKDGVRSRARLGDAAGAGGRSVCDRQTSS
jgi:4-alpha-glucanotransferase